MTTPSIGMCFDRSFPPTEVVGFAAALETGGVDEMWFIEDCFFTTAPPLAAVALSATDRLTVGLGILPAVHRPAAVTAMEIATLAGFGPGRVVAGIGHGVQDWMAQMGVATPSPVTTLDEVIANVKRLLAGDRVSFDGRHAHLDDIALEHVPNPTPAVVAGVRGPKSLAMAGRAADGVLLDAPCSLGYVECATTQCARSPDEFEYRCFATLCVRPDRTEARREVAGFVAEMARAGHAGLRHVSFADELAALAARDDLDAIVAMPDDHWLEIGPIGTLDDAVAHVGQLGDAGIRSVAMFPAPDLAVARAQLDDVIAVARALR